MTKEKSMRVEKIMNCIEQFSKRYRLTPSELMLAGSGGSTVERQVHPQGLIFANLIFMGYRTQELAKIWNVAPSTIGRKKLSSMKKITPAEVEFMATLHS